MIRVTDEAANDYEQISAISLTDDRLEALYKERFARKARIDAISVDIIRQIRLVWEHNFITRNKPNLLDRDLYERFFNGNADLKEFYYVFEQFNINIRKRFFQVLNR